MAYFLVVSRSRLAQMVKTYTELQKARNPEISLLCKYLSLFCQKNQRQLVKYSDFTMHWRYAGFIKAFIKAKKSSRYLIISNYLERILFKTMLLRITTGRTEHLSIQAINTLS